MFTFFENNDSCPTCTQPIDLRFKQTEIYEGKKKISELEEGLQKLSAEMGKTQEQLLFKHQLTLKMMSR